MDRTKLIRKSISAGIMISIGGAAYVSYVNTNKIFAAFMFSLALLSICALSLNLFTGKVYSIKLDGKGIIDLIFILVGNWACCNIMGYVIGKIKPELIETAREICIKKSSEGKLIIPLAIFCNVLVYIAVESYKKNAWYITILAVMAFVLLGFEHSIANMFYFALARMNNPVYISANVFFNAIGGLAMAYIS